MPPPSHVRPRDRAALAALLAGVLVAFGGCDPTVGQTGVILAISSGTPVDCVHLVAHRPGGDEVVKDLKLPAQAHTEWKTFTFRALVYSGGPLGDGAVVLSASGRRADDSGRCTDVEVASGAAAFSFTRGKTPEVPVALKMVGVDSDGDGYADAFDCAPNDPTVFPRSGPETGAECGNGVDDDCDGAPDDGCPCTEARSCYPLGLSSKVAGVGLCKLGTQACIGGVYGPCTGAVLPTAEQCDGLDEDCDGTPDPPSCPCEEGDTRGCYDAGPAKLAGVGRCAMGRATCHAGEWGPCVGAVAPEPESCNGVDDDCDGVVDDPGTVQTALCANQDGVCVLSRATCAAGAEATCDAADYGANAVRLGLTADAYSATEKCDGIDNNCDGRIDEGCHCTPGAIEACHPLGVHDVRATTGICRLGSRSCGADSTWGPCIGAVMPQPETCNGLDDDCDGTVDDDVPGTGVACDTGRPGVCKAGETRCVEGVLQCVATNAPSAETCDGKDDDCNGVVDDGFDKQNDPAHCGGPNDCRACADGNLCCAGRCSDSTSDPLNCGGCGKACDPGASCCGGGCFDLQTDHANCGRCGNACGGDEVCRGGSCRPTRETDCANGVDDDGDGKIDCADVEDCPAETACALDANGQATSVCRQGACLPVHETDCANGVDDDGDGKIDCADPDCTDGTRCGSEDGYAKWCRAGRCVVAVELDCADGLDDDGDGKVDCADPDCQDGAVCDDHGGVCHRGACAHETVCGDGKDDDGDGKIDCADPDCAAKSCDARGGVCQGGRCVRETSCKDGVDNNGDGKVDCEDTLACPSGTACEGGGTCCASTGTPVCAHETDCGNGIDDDCDGLIDCNDPDCAACAGGTSCCPDGACRDLAHDVHNCRACGNDCDDHNPCTADSCGATGCVHTPVEDRQTVAGCEGDSVCCGGRCVGAHESGAECTSGVDNDCDGLVGCQDPDCACGAGEACCGTACEDLSASAANCGACGHACPAPAECHVAVCADGGCGTGPAPNGTACTSVANGQCHDGACAPSHETAATCANGLDDDFDGLVDCQDPDCAASTAGLTFCPALHACVNLKTDPANCGACGVACASGVTCSNGACLRETTGDTFPFARTCADGKDDDGDGKVDCQDPDCVDGSQCTADGKAHCCGGACAREICNNGVDDDCDGLADCFDPDCLHQACDDHDLCTTGETCQDSSGSCGAGTPKVCPAPKACQTGPGVCDPATGDCHYGLAPSGTVCRASVGECDVTDVCDGVNPDCPSDAKKPANAACTDDGNPCTRDVCDGSGDLCTHPAGNPGAVCRPKADRCDVAEACTGASATCPVDAFVPAGGAGSPTCAPYVCAGTKAACPATCASDAGCDGTDWCSSGACVAKEGNGATCTASDQCSSGQCVDGFCCNTACGGACDACDLPGAQGTCTFRSAGATGSPSCAPQVCPGNSAACPGGCADDTGCIATDYCASGSCTPKKNNGQSCAGDDQCTSGHCIQGQNGLLCSAVATCPVCQVTNGTACVDATAGSDPKNECNADAANCVAAACDGAGTCHVADGTTCAASTCGGLPAQETDHSCSAGVCTPSVKSCGLGFLCNGGLCSGSCTVGTDAGCDSSHYCVGGSSCQAKKTDGQSCAAADQCTSGHCVQGQNGLLCSAVASCPTCEVTDGTSCVDATAGSDPKNECNANSASCVAANCDGAGTCHVGDGTTCAASSCAAGTPATETDHTCTGGVCGSAGASCNGYVCNGTTCGKSCVDDTGCDSAHWCSGGTCQAKKANGQGCTAADQCSGGFCDAGQSGLVCASLACPQFCQVVDSSGTTCLAAQVGTDPKGDCTASMASCKQANCNGGTGAHACDVPDSTSCGSSSCTGGVETDPACASGSCTNPTKSCSGFSCASTVCGTSCDAATNSGCDGTHYCVAGSSCAARQADGASCSADFQCANGHCSTTQTGAKVCSTTACGAACQVAAADGKSCVAASSGTDPKNDCSAATCLSANCNGTTGADACDLANGTSCGTSSCSTGSETDPKCQSGSCQNAVTSCGAYVCNGAACYQSCSTKGTNGPCAAGSCCNGSSCVGETLATSCGASCADCTSGGTGYDKACYSGTSCGCTSGSDCGGGRPYCDTTSTHACVACLADANCLPGEWCSSGSCVAQVANGGVCAGADECESGYCPSNTVCTACTADANCPANHACQPSTSSCQLANGQSCSSGSDCASGYCTSGSLCAACTGNGQCASNVCDQVSGKCQ